MRFLIPLLFVSLIAPAASAQKPMPAPKMQFVRNPAYNRDRGPVVIAGFRVHLEL